MKKGWDIPSRELHYDSVDILLKYFSLKLYDIRITCKNKKVKKIFKSGCFFEYSHFTETVLNSAGYMEYSKFFIKRIFSFLKSTA